MTLWEFVERHMFFAGVMWVVTGALVVALAQAIRGGKGGS